MQRDDSIIFFQTFDSWNWSDRGISWPCIISLIFSRHSILTTVIWTIGILDEWFKWCGIHRRYKSVPFLKMIRLLPFHEPLSTPFKPSNLSIFCLSTCTFLFFFFLLDEYLHYKHHKWKCKLFPPIKYLSNSC